MGNPGQGQLIWQYPETAYVESIETIEEAIEYADAIGHDIGEFLN